ncbi:MAG: hypothetical protein VX836_12270 [Pseudomonadota bacterium]|nr:hypothetical protein [Pseudomonadota bacterium]
MKTITIEVSDEDAALIEAELPDINRGEANSHGPLDLQKLAAMLIEDVTLAIRRPGSWEGANMSQVLASHGYEL